MNKVELVLQGLHNMGFQTKELKGLGYIYGYEDIPLIYIPILFAGSGISPILSMILRQISTSGTRRSTIIRL